MIENECVERQTRDESFTSFTREQWDDVSRRLREPFDPNDVDFRVQGRATEQGRAQVVAYIDARAVQERLDAVVGAGNWSFDWTPLVIDNGEVMVAKGTLSVLGVSKSDAGSASNFEQSLGAVSHCFKRAAVHWGIGRYLYNLPASWVSVEKGGRISEQVLRELRAKLPHARGARPQIEVDEVPATGAPADGGRAVRASESGTHAKVAQNAPAAAPKPVPATSGSGGTPATDQQLVSIRKLCATLGKPEPEPGLTYGDARLLITQLSGEYQRARRAS